jgi:DNA invertase Pin-like site-specific DNA recombinase
MKKAVAIYARVSTDRQTVDMQIHELKEYVKRSLRKPSIRSSKESRCRQSYAS